MSFVSHLRATVLLFVLSMPSLDAFAYLTSTDVESIACVNAASRLGNDPSVCVEDGIVSCRPPDWFPVVGDGGSADAYKTIRLDADQRWNQSLFGGNDFQHWEHTWLSKSDAPFGPATPDDGHEWNEYAGSELVRSYTCNSHVSYSYP